MVDKKHIGYIKNFPVIIILKCQIEQGAEKVKAMENGNRIRDFRDSNPLVYNIPNQIVDRTVEEQIINILFCRKTKRTHKVISSYEDSPLS